MQRADIDASLAARLVAEQFPRWAQLPVTEVAESGWDNRTFRLGTELSVRLPSAEAYAAAVAKELTWLPRLAPGLPVPIPAPVAEGRPSGLCPWPWSVRRWLPGRTVSRAAVGTDPRFAGDLARFLVALQRIDAADGPAAGPQSFHRGSDLAVYDEQTRHSIDLLGDRIPADAVAVWEAARGSPWGGEPVWFHGDVAAGNLLTDAGRLSAVIDFGTCGVGDPACDLVPAWTLFEGAAREEFRTGVDAPGDTWARARGWALWKALITAAAGREVGESLRTVAAVIDEHRGHPPG